jgi:lambda family phage portal protein
VAVKAVARDGEAVFRKVRGRQFAYGLKLQLLEADRIDETMNQRLASGNVVRMGVEIDGAGRAQALWLWTTHPGENVVVRGAKFVERVPMEDLYHLYVPERAEQVRGYSWMHAVLLRSQMLHGYEEAAVIAARVGAAKMGVFSRKEDAGAPNMAGIADGQDDLTGKLHINAEPGEFLQLPDGYSLDSWDPQYPHEQFGAFVKACLRGIAAGLDVDYATLSNDLESVNYSSIRAGTIETREQWITLQEWLIDNFLAPLYRDWLTIALPMGAITFPSGTALPAGRLDKFIGAAEFACRRWPWVDPLKDAQAVRELIEMRLTSRTRVAAQQGMDFAEIAAELAQEEQVLRDAGIEVNPGTPKPPARPEPQEAVK